MAMAEANHTPDGGSIGGSSSGGGVGGGSYADPSTVPANDELNGGDGGGTTPEDAGAAGYTPLDDLEVGGGAVHLPSIAGNEDENGESTFVFSYQQSVADVFGPEDWSDYSDDDDDDNDRKLAARGAEGAFYANTAAFGPANDDGDGDGLSPVAQGWTRLSPSAGGGANNDSANGDDGGIDDEMDFRAIADRALRSLDEEYTSTVRADGGEPATVISATPASRNEVRESTAAIEVNNKRTNDDTSSADAEEDEEHRASPPSADADDATPSPAAQHKQPLPPPPVGKELPPIDADAVRRAVQSMRIKSPDLTSNLDDGAERRFRPKVVAPESHPLIPDAPLAAFLCKKCPESTLLD